MKDILIKVNGIEQLPQAAQQFIEEVPLDRVIAFYGQMGAGKTTFIRAICEALRVPQTVTSPTFALVYEYSYGVEKKIYHFDFYRINRLEEAYDLGYEEYFYSGDLCLVEWPEKIESLLPEDAVIVNITVLNEHDREIRVKFV
jgi:tRNA threonylcarbamoyladenosine biosynthesis protein TsaE